MSISALQDYAGSWRRMEHVATTEHGNPVFSDYGHHPTEVRVTLEAFHGEYPDKKIILAFQPHQHSRTYELLDEFLHCFDDADTLIISDIYASRDTQQDIDRMSTDHFVHSLTATYPDVCHGGDLSSTSNLLKKVDANTPNSSVIILMGAGNIDSLREIW